ncbi:hypothetical protein [Polaribacter sargassicola]|uniref:hypothetical protein n=1 Tax=Polaribacter sargassicola TaxID=2836891 RepID=UPI001F37C718|nr:hypothetical protein [Polaribacter sp. DS7-9]MCG1037351.1 hypothetical protein [Polaribacter sp. DS7-9]
MSEENIKNLMDKYKSGTSSLEEEKELFDNVNESEPEIKTWASFVKKNKKVAPDNFNDKLWESFDKKTSKNNRFKIGLISVAASVLFISTLFMNNIKNESLSNEEKEALLNEAKNMFIEFDKSKPKYNVLVESDLLIVYTKTE